MKKPIHRILALLPMLALAISALMYSFYGIIQFQYKIAAKQSIFAKKGLYTITMSLKDFNKLPNHNEVWYGGQLYDINSYTAGDNKVSLVIFHDEKEESFVKQLIDDFRPYGQYLSDNTVHIIKHRVRLPDDNKILAMPLSLKQYVPCLNEHHALPYIIKYATPVYSHVLKPPPDMA